MSIIIFIIFLRLPELRLNAEPFALPDEVRSPPRASCYDNVHDLRPMSEQVRFIDSSIHTDFHNKKTSHI